MFANFESEFTFSSLWVESSDSFTAVSDFDTFTNLILLLCYLISPPLLISRFFWD